MTLVAIGMGACGLALRGTATQSTVTLFYAGAAAVGVGLLTPFKHPLLGAILGILAAGVTLGVGALIAGIDC
jgi:hypothetical protein